MQSAQFTAAAISQNLINTGAAIGNVRTDVRCRLSGRPFSHVSAFSIKHRPSEALSPTHLRASASLQPQGVVGFALTPQVASQLAQSNMALATSGATATVVSGGSPTVTVVNTNTNTVRSGGQAFQSTPSAVRVVAAQSVRKY